MLTQNKNCHLCNVLSPGGRLNIKMSFQYRDPHVKDKTVLSLTWESPYLGKTIFVLKRGPAIPADYILEVVVIIQFPFTSYIIYFEYTFMAVDGLVTQGAMASVAMIASLLMVPNLCMADASLGAQQHIKILSLICFNLFFSCDQAALRTLQSVCLFVCLSVHLLHLFHHVAVIVSSRNFQELLPFTKLMSMQKVKARGQWSRSQRSWPHLAVSGP